MNNYIDLLQESDRLLSATKDFLGLYFEILREGKISSDQTAYLSSVTAPELYLELKVSDNLKHEYDEYFLNIAAAISLLCELVDKFEEGRVEEDRYIEITDILRNSWIFDISEFSECLDFLRDRNDSQIPVALGKIFKKYIFDWWVQAATRKKALDTHF